MKSNRGFVLANIALWGVAVAVVGWVALRPDGETVPTAAVTPGARVAGTPVAGAPAAGTPAGAAAQLTDGQALAALNGWTPAAPPPGTVPRPQPEFVNGWFVEDFYRASTGDLRQDLALATAEGKPLAIFWEREYCEYCARLHTEAFTYPKLYDYVKNRFYVVKADFHGRKTITDLDGTQVTEEEARTRHRVQGTPTMEFRTADQKEVLRIPGYVEPDILLAAFEYVDQGVYTRVTLTQWMRELGLF